MEVLLWLRTYVERPVDADDKPLSAGISNEPSARPDPVQMNVRMSSEDHILFNSYCKNLHLNQREGFSLLLDHARKDPNYSHLSEILSQHKDHVEKLEAALQKQKSKEVAHVKDRDLLRDYIAFLKPALDNYLSLILPHEPSQPAIKVVSYSKIKRSKEDFAQYRYPEEEGHTLITLDCIAWGRPCKPARFIFGKDPLGRPYKFRYYPKKSYLGMPIPSSPYACLDSKWYIGYTRASDSAMDLVFSFPVPEVTPAMYEVPENNSAAIERLEHRPCSTRSLDDMIFFAQKNKNKKPRKSVDLRGFSGGKMGIRTPERF